MGLEQEQTQLRESGPDIEYKYVVHVLAVETFANILRRQGVEMPAPSAFMSFSWPKRLNMKTLKENGIVKSYDIIRVRTNEEILEEG